MEEQERRYSSWLLERLGIGDVIRLRFGASTIGRHSSSVIRILDSKFVSRNHAEIIVFDDDKRVEIRDLKSVNGVFVNNAVYKETKVKLEEGDRIGIGVSCVDEEQDFNFEYPFYILKHMPITGSYNKARSNLNEPTTSRAASTANDTSKGEVVNIHSDQMKLNHINEKSDIKERLTEEASTSKTCERSLISKVETATSFHMPQISNIKKEKMLSVTDDIHDIFGGPDEIILDNLKEINPYLFNQLNSQPIQSSKNVENRPLMHGDVIDLVSDDEEMQGSCSSFGKIVETPNNIHEKTKSYESSEHAVCNKSPNIFDTSFNNSKEAEKSQANPNQSPLTEPKNIETTETTAEDENDFMFSQLIIDEIKSELAEDKNDEEVVVGFLNNHNDFNELVKKGCHNINHEEDTSAETATNGSYWLISDDEDENSDEELKVSNWSTKLFSQSFSQINASQVYDLNDTDDDNDDGEDESADKSEDKRRNERILSVDETDDEDCVDNNDIYNRDVHAKQIMDDMMLGLENRFEFENVKDNNTKNEQRVGEKCNDEPESLSETNEGLESPRRDSDILHSPIIRHRSNKRQRVFIIDEDDEDEVPKSTANKIEEQAATTSKEIKDSNTAARPIVTTSNDRGKLKSTEASAKHSKPMLVEAPHLPRHKGKLRGVSASTTTHSKNLAEKLKAVQETVKEHRSIKELKQKWHEKPGVSKRRQLETIKNIKELRKERLKRLADEQQHCESLKRKLSNTNEERTPKQLRVKITKINRGAFLTEPSAAAYKIPKVKKNSNDNSEKAKPPNAPQESGALTINDKNEQALALSFSKALSKPDDLLLKQNKKAEKTHATEEQPFSSSMKSPEGLREERKEAASARAQRTTNKITFASMQQNFLATCKNQNKLKSMLRQRAKSGESGSRRNTIETEIEGVKEDEVKKMKKKKKVRFNETPQIRYIERVKGACKKVHDQKDAIPRPWYNDRRHMVRTTYPLKDYEHKILFKILDWCNEWLVKRNADVGAAEDVIYPMPNKFNSFEHYKSIVFPLMKLEFLSMLEREYLPNKTAQPIKVSLENGTYEKNFLILIGKYNCASKMLKSDLVILTFPTSKIQTFAYVVAQRRGSVNYNSIVLQMLPMSTPIELKNMLVEVLIYPVVDNIRVEFGAFNAVYQLEATPLFSKILNPLELLKCKLPPKPKTAYKGYDVLNDNQRQILLNTYLRIIDETTPNITLIQGPPGTGKSQVITNLALQSLYGQEVHCLDKKLLICAQSNGAVDVIAKKLYHISLKMRPEIQFRVVRFGVLEKISASVAPISLQKLVERDQLRRLQAKNPKIQIENKEYLREQILQLTAQIVEMQSRNIKGTVEEDELLEKQRQLQMMRNVEKGTMRPNDEHSVFKWFLNNANIVCATLSSCVKLSQYMDYFDICIIDEATQCTEPWTLLPLKFGINSLVLVGDTQQLPATVLSRKAYDFGLGTSMFTRIQRCLEQTNSTDPNTSKAATTGSNAVIYSLHTQYRMHPEICKWPNAYFYKNELINAPITLQYKSELAPFSILNLTYTQNEGCRNGKIVNNMEAQFVAKLLKVLDGYLPTTYNSYGVITPYAQHRNILAAAIKSMGLTNIMVNTIDSYQGVEKDVIVISNARTSGIGFLSNYQRLNVALTRPKKCLILCGNFQSLESVPVWRNLLNNCRERKLFHELSADCMDDVRKHVFEKIKIKHGAIK